MTVMVRKVERGRKPMADDQEQNSEAPKGVESWQETSADYPRTKIGVVTRSADGTQFSASTIISCCYPIHLSFENNGIKNQRNA
jgi:hypothetical protein